MWFALLLALAGAVRPSAVPAQPAAAHADPDAAAATPRWLFEPLGPDGAYLTRIAPLACDAWLAQSADGSLFAWDARPSDPAGGAWEALSPFGAEGEGAVLFSVHADRARVWILDGSGGLWHWSPLAADEGPVRCGQVGEEAARRAVAMIPDDGPSASPTPAGPPGLLVITRDGVLARAGRSAGRWNARFVTRTGDADAADPLRPPIVRGAARLPGEPEGLLALCEWEGLFISRDGGLTFLPVEGGLPRQISAFHVCPWTAALFAAASEGIYASRDGARSWTLALRRGAVPSGQEDPIAQLQTGAAQLGDELWAVTRRGLLLWARLGGAAWERQLADLPVEIHGVASARGEVRVATPRGVLARAAGGAPWVWRNEGLRRVSVFAIVPPAGEGDPLIVETDAGPFCTHGERGPWEPAEPREGGEAEGAGCAPGERPSAPPGREALCCCPGPDGFWLGTDDGIFLGSPPDEWAFAGLAGERILEVAASPPLPWLFARTPEHLYATDTRGATWEEIPLPAGLRVTTVALDAPGGRVLLGAFHHGLFAARLPEPRAAGGEPLAIHGLPNPFTAAVTLRCEVPGPPARGRAGAAGTSGAAAGGTTEILPPGEASADAMGLAELEARVYSVHGQLVRRLSALQRVSDASGALSLQWEWDGLDERGLPVANGVYLVTTSAGTQRMLGKLIKLR